MLPVQEANRYRPLSAEAAVHVSRLTLLKHEQPHSSDGGDAEDGDEAHQDEGAPPPHAVVEPESILEICSHRRLRRQCSIAGHQFGSVSGTNKQDART